MKISIVTVCYNSQDTIRDTIESVLSQSYPHIEHIVIDGASTDGTLAIINEYRDRIAKIVSEPDKGIYDAMNKGISMSTGEIIGILNSDDFFEYPDALSDIAQSFQMNPWADLVFGDVVFVDPINLNKIVRYYSSRNFKTWKLRFGWMPPHPGTFIRKKTYDQAGPYALDYKTGADYEMFVRLLLAHGLNYKYVDKVIVRMRTGGATTSGFKSYLNTSSEMVKALKDNGYYSNLLIISCRLPIKFFELIKKPISK